VEFLQRSLGHPHQKAATPMASTTLDAFNRSPLSDATKQLSAVCASSRWAKAVAGGRPYKDFCELSTAAAREWARLSEADYLESFKGHPRIGGTRDPAKARRKSEWAKQESAGVEDAAESTVQALQRENDAYFGKFGFVFLVCATGKSAEEMLGLLRARIGNERTAEVRIAAAEEAKITQIRLAKMFPLEASAAQSSL
jgi:2-oxo-4-hydroxy-4-carboxy-5-ureidoimidazoline decarboxylase